MECLLLSIQVHVMFMFPNVLIILLSLIQLCRHLYNKYLTVSYGCHETVWQSTVVIKCTEHSSTGISFVNSSNITFRYITVTNCGADMTSLCWERFLCNDSLGFFRTGHTIALDHVSIQNGTSNGLLKFKMAALLSH